MTNDQTAGIAITQADYADSADAALLADLLDAYARDPMGGGVPLSAAARAALAPGMAAAGGFSLIARDDGAPVGLANCFVTFATFAGQPLVNIHDLVVVPAARGRGVGKALLHAVEAEARARGADKVTLEVLTGNTAARALYARLGYGDYQLDPAMGHALFWQKTL